MAIVVCLPFSNHLETFSLQSSTIILRDLFHVVEIWNLCYVASFNYGLFLEDVVLSEKRGR